MIAITLTLTLISPVLSPSVSLPCSASGTSSLPGQDVMDLKRLVQDRVRAAQDLPPERLAELWSSAYGLIDLAEDSDVDALPSVLDRELGREPATSDAGTLFLASARLLTDDPDYDLVAVALRRVALNRTKGFAQAALELLANPEFALLSADGRDGLATGLRVLLDDEGVDSILRIRTATVLHKHGRDVDQRDARTLLLDLLQNEAAEARALAALSLAELGDIESAREELAWTAKRPDPAGELARAYLKQEKIRAYEEQHARNIAKGYRSTGRESEFSADPDLIRLERVMRLIEDDSLDGESLERDALIASGLNGMLGSLDDHSSFLVPEYFKSFDQDLQGEYGGIGAYVAEDRHDHLFTITRPIYSGPAYEAGLQTDDKIVKIDDWSTVGEEVNDIIKRLKGKPGTSIKLYVWRRGMSEDLIENPTEEMTVTIDRAQIVIPPVQALMLPGKIGLVELTTFSRQASSELEHYLRQLVDMDMNGFVLDLRSNSGGLLSEARNVSDLFLPRGVDVVSTDSRVEDKETLRTRRKIVLPKNVPMTVLVNRFSASASEIVAGALQDHGRAQIVGRRSFGKGSVQKLYDVGDDDGFIDENRNRRFDPWEKLTSDQNENGEFDYAPRVKMTMARYLLPSGRSIHHEFDELGNETSKGGIDPDVEQEVRRREQWRLEGMIRVNRSGLLREWVADNYDEYPDQLLAAALCDFDDVTRYPNFDQLYDSLGTTLPRQDVRFLLRREVRRRAQDALERAFPAGDFQEDAQLQRSCAVMLAKKGIDWHTVPEFSATFDLDQPEPSAEDRLAARPPDEASELVQEILSRVREARRGDGQLSEDNRKRLRDIFQAALGG